MAELAKLREAAELMMRNFAANPPATKEERKIRMMLVASRYKPPTSLQTAALMAIERGNVFVSSKAIGQRAFVIYQTKEADYTTQVKGLRKRGLVKTGKHGVVLTEAGVQEIGLIRGRITAGRLAEIFSGETGKLMWLSDGNYTISGHDVGVITEALSAYSLGLT